MNDGQGIFIDGEKLTAEINRAESDRCLDMHTGRIVPAAECPKEETGDGHTALALMKRYIRIPIAGKLREQIAAALNAEGSAGSTVLYVPTALHQEFRKWLRAPSAAGAEEATARLWIASLRPSVPVGWMESDCVAFVYDPKRGRWR
jgi:hypothetical protein